MYKEQDLRQFFKVFFQDETTLSNIRDTLCFLALLHYRIFRSLISLQHIAQRKTKADNSLHTNFYLLVLEKQAKEESRGFAKSHSAL